MHGRPENRLEKHGFRAMKAFARICPYGVYIFATGTHPHHAYHAWRKPRAECRSPQGGKREYREEAGTCRRSLSMACAFASRFEGPENAPVLMLSNSLASNLGMWDPQMPAFTQPLPGAAL